MSYTTNTNFCSSLECVRLDVMVFFMLVEIHDKSRAVSGGDGQH